jgi:hypothetical protein
MSANTGTTVQFQLTTSESLEQARTLLRELIDRVQTDASTGQVRPPTSLSRILVHVANIQKFAAQSSKDSANATKRLRDFANTIERLRLGGENMADAQDIRAQLIAVLRLAANQLGGNGAIPGQVFAMC